MEYRDTRAAAGEGDKSEGTQALIIRGSSGRVASMSFLSDVILAPPNSESVPTVPEALIRDM